MGGGSSASSSGEEDGDADWRAAIDSIAAVGIGISVSNGLTKAHPATGSPTSDDPRREQQRKDAAPRLKLYQIKVQKLLDDLLDKSLEMVKNPMPLLAEKNETNVAGIRLFRKAPPGMILDPVDQHPQPRRRPRILRGEEIDEKSKKFKRQLRSVAVDGTDIMAAARESCRRSLSRFEAKDAAARAAAKKEEERVAELKKLRGERWLPSIARVMQSGARAQGGR